VSLSISSSSPVASFEHRSNKWPLLLRRSASRVLTAPGHPTPCATSPCARHLPCALVGHDSHEYYEHSVILGLASLTIPCSVTEERARTTWLPMHPFNALAGHRPIHAGCTIGKSRTHARDGVGVRCAAKRVCGSTPGEWDANNPVFAVSLEALQDHSIQSSAVPRFPTCSCPLALSGLVSCSPRSH